MYDSWSSAGNPDHIGAIGTLLLFIILFSSVKRFSRWPYLFLSLHLSLFLVFVSFVEKSLVSFAWGSRPGVDGVGAQHLQIDGVGQVGVLRPGAPTTTP